MIVYFSNKYYNLVNFFRYHLGTAAAGSMIMLICQVIGGLINLLSLFGKDTEDCLSVTSYFTCCDQNLVYTVKYASRNAYVNCATHGRDFYNSGKNAFNLIMRNKKNVTITTLVRI